MNWKIEYVADDAYVRITNEGVYSPEAHLEMMQDALAQPFWKPGTPVLLDNRRLHYTETDLDDLRRSSEDMRQGNELIGDSKIAFLTATRSDYETIRRFELMTEEDVSAWMHAFFDEKEALRWLLAYRVKQTDAGGGGKNSSVKDTAEPPADDNENLDTSA